jgi:predicted ATPase
MKQSSLPKRYRILKGWALAELGQGEEGIALIHKGLASSQTEGAELGRPYFLALLVEAYGKMGKIADGLTTVDEALAIANKNTEGCCQSELYRLKGQLSLQQTAGNEQQAETCFHRALSMARSRGAKSPELRAAVSLARLWRQQGKTAEARSLLAEIYGWFTEGFDTADLKEAKALLEENNSYGSRPGSTSGVA